MSDWKERPIAGPSAEFDAYTKTIVEERKKIPPRPKSVEQCASTQRILNMTDEEHAKHLSRPWPPEGWKSDEDVDVAMANTLARVGPEQYSHASSVRHAAKNNFGSSDKPGYSEEKKDRAVEAFRYSKPTALTKEQEQKLTKIEPIVEFKELPKEKKKSFWRKLFSKPELEAPKAMIEKIEFKEEWQRLIGEKKDE